MARPKLYGMMAPVNVGRKDMRFLRKQRQREAVARKPLEGKKIGGKEAENK